MDKVQQQLDEAQKYINAAPTKEERAARKAELYRSLYSAGPRPLSSLLPKPRT